MQGLMWSDSDSTKTYTDRIMDAANRYHEKLGHWPTHCQVPLGATDLPDELKIEPGHTVRVVPAREILIYHVLVGHNGTGESDDG